MKMSEQLPKSFKQAIDWLSEINQEYKSPELWIIKVDGKQIVVKSGKHVWKAKNHASCALTHHFGSGPSCWMMKGEDKDMTWQEREKEWSRLFTEWKEKHVVFERIR